MSFPIVWTNNAATTLAFSISSGSTTATLASGTGALFPSPGAGQYFTLTLISATSPTTLEITYCTARIGDVVTLERAQEGTSALAWSAGDLAQNLLTAGSMSLLAGLLNNNFANYQVFTSSGSWPTPSGVTNALATVVAGGGGGSNCQGGSLSTDVSGGGGGAGGLGIGIVSVSGTIAITVGTGGGAQAAGGTSSFGSAIVANGGSGSSFVLSATSAGGVGGTATGGSILNQQGGWGSDGQSATFVFAGNGAPGPWGGGGRAGSGPGGGGEAATGYGAGGGGAYDPAMSNTLYPGGAGGGGIVIVQW